MTTLHLIISILGIIQYVLIFAVYWFASYLDKPVLAFAVVSLSTAIFLRSVETLVYL